MPPHASKFFDVMAPFIAVSLALVSISIIPFGPEVPVPGGSTFMEIADLNVGILFILAVGAVSVYGIALAGWSSNNKYSLMGGLRSSAQMISYELPFTRVIVSPLLLANHLSFRGIAESQAGYYFNLIPRWSIFQMPFPQIFSFIIFMIAGFAETNRIPFDLPEAENELVAGFHTEYSSMKFACFFMAEYANMVTIACVATILFLGGWHPLFPAPWSNWVPTLVFLWAAFWLFVQGGKIGRKVGSYYFPSLRIRSLGTGADIRDSFPPNLSRARFLVRVQGGIVALRLYLDSRNPAAFPLRPIDALCVDVSVPVRASQPFAHCLNGGVVPGPKVMDSILFIIAAVAAVGCGLNLVLQKHPISSALSLIGVMSSLALLYLLLGAEFIAMAQMIVYGGAVMVLFIFVIMLLNAGTEKRSEKSLFAQIAGFPLLAVLVVLLAFLIRETQFPSKVSDVRFGSWVGGTAEAIGIRLFGQFLLPFEVISVLILIAILGAVVLARKEID